MTINIKCQNEALASGPPNFEASTQLQFRQTLLEYQNRFPQQQVEEGIPAEKAVKVNAFNTDGFWQTSPTGLHQLRVSSSFQGSRNEGPVKHSSDFLVPPLCKSFLTIQMSWQKFESNSWHTLPGISRVGSKSLKYS